MRPPTGRIVVSGGSLRIVPNPNLFSEVHPAMESSQRGDNEFEPNEQPNPPIIEVVPEWHVVTPDHFPESGLGHDYLAGCKCNSSGRNPFCPDGCFGMSSRFRYVPVFVYPWGDTTIAVLNPHFIAGYAGQLFKDYYGDEGATLPPHVRERCGFFLSKQLAYLTSSAQVAFWWHWRRMAGPYRK